MCLSIINSHIRDKNLIFYKRNHKYEVVNDRSNKYLSVTSWAKTFFEVFDADLVIKRMMASDKWCPDNKYWGMSVEEIKRVWNKAGIESSCAGTKLHNDIERFMNLKFLVEDEEKHKDLVDKTSNVIRHIDLLNEYNKNKEKYRFPLDSIEWNYFINFVKENEYLLPYRTEWMIYDEDIKIAGSVDMIYKNEDGSFDIYDWKRCKEIVKDNNYNKYAQHNCLTHIPSTNYYQYALQLNIYKKILESKYLMVIRNLYLVRLHPEGDNYELINLPILESEMELLYSERIVLHESSPMCPLPSEHTNSL